eukprot:TRINITY_DN957_c1_g1_i1.p1 TRINITY_DN957_c1_g1~~TRINITY_DN957_c1_g1_i1.p1  ORF type:complete len:406 (-),score=25.09 TRINITY_DN957_c1_g1_i1:223-1326(-)
MNTEKQQEPVVPSTPNSKIFNGKYQWQKSSQIIQKQLSVSSCFTTLRVMYPDNQIEEHKIKVLKKLGTGQFGTVLKCIYGREVLALKFLKSKFQNCQAEALFVKEMAILQKLRHPNIVHYIGTGKMMLEGQQQVFLAQECMEGGSLYSLLTAQGQQCGRRLYSVFEAYEWMLDVAKGMSYLHNSYPVVIHRDLKLENILLNTSYKQRNKATIADFGLYTLISVSNEKKEERFNLTGGTGSYIYMAPEVLLNKPYNTKIDVFSFAMIMFEVFSYSMLIHKISLGNMKCDLMAFAYRQAYGIREAIPQTWPQQLQILIQQCWAANADDRPPFDVIVTKLEELRADMEEWDSRLLFSSRSCFASLCSLVF